MMKRLVLLFYVLSFTPAFPQEGAAVILMQESVETVSPRGWTVDGRTIDSACLTVSYRLDHIYDTIGKRAVFNMMRLQVGKNRSKYFAMIRQLTDEQVAKYWREGFSLPSEEMKGRLARAGDTNSNGELWTDLSARKITERYHAYDENDIAITYDEPLPDLQWEMLADTATVCGYTCFVAKTQFRGRVWTAWFAPEIPVGAGPWKLRGLPGLILQAEDAAGHYRWMCTDIQNAVSPILWQDVKPIKLSRSACRKLLINTHRSPVQSLYGDQKLSSLRIVDRQKQWHDGSAWNRPYNPIELE